MSDAYLARKLEGLKIAHNQEFEQILQDSVDDPERFKAIKKDVFEQWRYFFGFYQKIIEDEVHSANPLEYILLGVLAEGLVKISLFCDNPENYVHKEKKDRTLGKLIKELVKLIQEPNETKKVELKESLSLITELRNNFVHFPFYSTLDYRFRWLYFQVFAYLFDKFSLWENLDYSEEKVIKKIALEKPIGVSLLEVDLYEQ